jgi:hypothetical protein
VHRWTGNLAVVFLSLLGVFLLEPGAIATMNSPPKRVLILGLFGRNVAPFNKEGSGDG